MKRALLRAPPSLGRLVRDPGWMEDPVGLAGESVSPGLEAPPGHGRDEGRHQPRHAPRHRVGEDGASEPVAASGLGRAGTGVAGGE